jgi:hypothetical protein
LAQFVSCVLWVYKRKSPDFPALDGNFLHRFLEISSWPYAFVTRPDATQFFSVKFPGQLLITGIVFFPTLIIVTMLIVYSIFLKLAELAKSQLISRKLDNLCRLILRINLIGIFESAESVKGFGYCNLAFLVLLNGSLVALFGALVSRLV